MARRKLLERHVNFSLRNRFTNLRHEQLLDDVRSKLGDDFIGITTDTTIKSLSRPNIGPFTLGFVKMTKFQNVDEQFGIPFDEQQESERIAKILDEYVRILYGDSFEEKKHLVLILTIDSAAANGAAANILINEYHYIKLLHVGCVVHGLHNFTKRIPESFEKLDKLMMGVKYVFRY